MLEQKLEGKPTKKRSWLRNLVLYGAIGLAGLIGGCDIKCNGPNQGTNYSSEGANEENAVELKFTPKKEGLKRLEAQLKVPEIDSRVELPAGRYTVGFDIHIKQNGILEIAPGTELYFRKETGILCEGTLKAVGTKKQPIVFTALADVAPEQPDLNWRNITLEGEKASNSILEYCIVRMGNGRLQEGGYDDVTFGGGIHIDHSSPTIRHCLIEDNHSTKGGGLYVSTMPGQKCVIEFNTIQNNRGPKQTSSNNQGGGLYISSESTIKGNIIKNNQSDYGGGIYIPKATYIGKDESGQHKYYTPPSIINNVIINNQAENHGGGIYIDGENWTSNFTCPIIEGNLISENKASKYGGGINSDCARLTLRNNTITKNTAEYAGGIRIYLVKGGDLVYLSRGLRAPDRTEPPIIENNTIEGNKPDNELIEWR
jgi:hypothetical protein